MTFNFKSFQFNAYSNCWSKGFSHKKSGYDSSSKFDFGASKSACISSWSKKADYKSKSFFNADKCADKGATLSSNCYHELKDSKGGIHCLVEVEAKGWGGHHATKKFFAFHGQRPDCDKLSFVKTCKKDGHWIDLKCLDDEAPANSVPTFTNVRADAVICVDENQTFVIDLAAHDADGDALTYEIAGGADAGAFEIDAETGELTFVAGPDYEAPTDANGNNVYNVTVKVSDGQGGETITPLHVKVKDVAENGWIKGRFTVDADGNDNEWNAELCKWDDGIEGATVELLDMAGNVVATSTTDACGNYAFDVPAGEYRVKFPAQDNSEFSAQNSGVAEHYDSDADENGVTDVITVTAGCAVYNVDTGVKTITTPQNGACMVVEAEDMQLCGYRVENNANASEGQLIKGSACKWASAETTFEGAAGAYDLKLSVLDECDGNGRICVSVNGQWVLDTRLNQNDGGSGTKNSTFRVLEINDIDLKPGDVVKIWGLGNRGEFARIDKLEFCGEKTDPMTAELGDTVWFDADKDGVRDANEMGMGNVTVLLKDADGNTIDQTETDAQGNYLFSDLAAGDYKVCVVAPAALVFTDQNAGGNDALDSDVAANGMSDMVTLATGESNLTVDAGLVDPGTASLEGRVFCDENRNDVDDAEGAVDNVSVTLLTAAGVVVATTTTAADGSYSFTGLDAGDYKVEFDTDTLDGKNLVATDAGSDDTIDSDADASCRAFGITFRHLFL